MVSPPGWCHPRWSAFP